ncbi:MAG: hypothetical protein QOF23_741, partial [Solirubrobacterales bacterium]|nr:hypothetical protein [Solirubrobacterales bacterium]
DDPRTKVDEAIQRAFGVLARRAGG